MGPAELPAGAVRCIGGANRGPVEDAGGTSGYARLIEALADPSDEERQELSDWYQFATGQDAGTFEPYTIRRRRAQQPFGRPGETPLAGTAHGR